MRKIIITSITIVVFGILPATLFAATQVTLQGEFQGANCIFYNKVCPPNMSDGHIALEPDFVFVFNKGKYVFVPNLDRALKVKYLHSDVELVGSQNGDSFHAELVKIKTKGAYKTVWSLAEEKAERAQMEMK